MNHKDQLQLQTVDEMSTAEILQEYNALTGNDCKRFSSREDGVRRLLKAREEHAAAEHVKTLKHPAKSAGTRQTWTCPVVRQKRSVRTAVRCYWTGADGKEAEQNFASVPAAFRALELYWPQHGVFRQHLKSELRLQYNMKKKKVFFVCIDASGKELTK